MLNGYQWDFPLLAALAAPRPLLLSNSDKDTIFPLNGVVRLHEKLKEVYRLYGQEEKLGLFISEGPHADTQVLQVAAFEWMERHLKGKKNSPIERVGEKLFTPQQLKVLAEAPADARNGEIHKQFIPDAEPPPVPLNLGGWEQMRLDWMGKLRQKVFRNWPKATEPLNLARVAGKSAQGLRLERYEFTSEENIRLPLWVVTAPVSGTGTNNTNTAPKRVELRVLDEASWKEWVGEIGPLFAAQLGVSQGKAERPQSVVRLKGRLSRRPAQENSVLAVFAPRGVGPTRWKVEESQHIRRRFHLLGLTWESAQVWDVRRAVRTLGEISSTRGLPVTLQGKESAAAVALYASLFEPSVKRLNLEKLPASHHQGPTLMNVLKYLDIPQAVALSFPRKVEVCGVAPQSLDWPQKVGDLFGKTTLNVHAVCNGSSE